jgi:NTE family protein
MNQALTSDTAKPKLGIALSGGGFRASFYHLGVLAKLAQAGVLKHVEVLSCVSGGSIIGSLYYLYVKKLLENNLDRQIVDQDYVKMIAEIETHFMQAVQKNLRMRTFLNPLKNLKMSLSHYSRSDHIGELFDTYLYNGLIEGHKGPIRMKDLKIRPVGNTRDFHPLKHNHIRKHKVPILLLNATVLNNGHNWRFDAASMGEPLLNNLWEFQADKNLPTQRPSSYDDIPNHADFPLGSAVAASACVPGIFPPLAISGFYDQDTRVQLIDGGVRDNQGIQGLLDSQMECTHFIISDASGQLENLTDPSNLTPSVLSRCNSIMMERIREEQLKELLTHHGERTMFIHLRNEFGADQQIQASLSKIRTDLDAFSEVESYALMMDAYAMTEQQLSKHTEMSVFKSERQTASPPFQFLRIQPWMEEPTLDFIEQLNIGEKLTFKVFYQSKSSLFLTVMTLFAFCLLLFHSLWKRLYPLLDQTFIQEFTVLDALIWGSSGFIILLLISLLLTARYIWTPQHPLLRFLITGIWSAVGAASISLFIALHLIFYNKIFLHYGKWSKLKPHPALSLTVHQVARDKSSTEPA